MLLCGYLIDLIIDIVRLEVAASLQERDELLEVLIILVLYASSRDLISYHYKDRSPQAARGTTMDC